MNTGESSFFRSFEDFCNGSLKTTGYEKYCQPIRNKAEQGTKWFRETATQAHDEIQKNWKLIGEHGGTTGQILVILIVAGIAYNFFGSKKKEKSFSKCKSSQIVAV